MKLVVQFDGAYSIARGIGGAGAVAFVDDQEVGHRKHGLRGVSTPVAEYTGLNLALQMAIDLGGTDVKVMGDAELIVHQFNRVYECRSEHLKPLLAYARLLHAQISQCEVALFPKGGPKMKRRWGNVRADQLAGEAMEAMA